MERIAKKIYDSKKGILYDNALVFENVKILRDALEKGYAKSIKEIAWDSPDVEMLANLERNIYDFSAAKNYHELQDFKNALYVDDTLRSFADFTNEIENISTKYNINWLRTEYNMAIASAQMASRWVQFQGDKKEMPILEYQTVGDENVRNEHRSLNGVRKGVEDPFWDSCYPPNGWGCRCEVIQVTAPHAQPTPDEKIKYPPIPALFKTNLGKNGLLFPKGHAYYTDIPNAVLRKAIAYLPPENTYYTVVGEKGTPIDIHPMHGKHELKGNLEIANDLIKHRVDVQKIQLLPDIHREDYKEKYKFLPEKYTLIDKYKNPDAVIVFKDSGSLVADFKSMQGNGRNLTPRINEAATKAQWVVIKLSKENELNQHGIERRITKCLAANKNLKMVTIFNYKGTLIEERTQ